jgi:ketosteroid isomerase-like protein
MLLMRAKLTRKSLTPFRAKRQRRPEDRRTATPSESQYAHVVSEQNVELFRRLVDAYSARDVEAFIAYCDPEIEFHAAWSVPGGTVYHGHDGLRKWHRDLEDAWEEIRAEPDAFYDLGEQTLVFSTLHARGRQSGAEVTMFNAVIAKWRDGLCVDLRAYVDRKDAVTDLGISEEGLEPIAP